MELRLGPDQQITLNGFNSLKSLYTSKYEELKKFNYAEKYSSLYRQEKDWDNYPLDYFDPTSEKIDLSLVPIIFDDPAPIALQVMNKNLFRATFRKTLLSDEYVYANQVLADWQSLSVDVETFYEKIRDFYLTIPEIKILKTIGDREAEVHQHIQDVLELRYNVRHYYSKDGNFMMGEAYLYRNAIQNKLDNYQTILESLTKHIDIFQKMKDMGMAWQPE